MNVIAYTPLLYGRDFLASAIRSIIDAVDLYHVLYSPVGSHGHSTDIPCPETRDELYAIAEQVAGSKLRWHDGVWAHEGYQRDSIHQYAPDADVIIALDADEIWDKGLVDTVIEDYGRAKSEGWTWNYHRLRVPIIHFWRSFNRAVLHDPAFPERFIFPKETRKEIGTLSDIYKPICHMGYAQRSEIVKFKLLTHGHKAEIRRDCDWFRDIFSDTERVNDLHLVGSEYWNWETVNPFDYMPSWMAEHPYATLEIIP